MARYRTIKPEFWTSEQVMECSTNARLMFIGMWNFADDAGRMSLSPKAIKAQIFPSDDISVENVRGMLDELSSNDLIKVYAVDGKEFLQITGWHHQKIDRPQKPKHPEPPPETDVPSTTDRRLLAPERKKERKNIAAGAASTNPKSYAFEDGVIRLNERDFESWQKAYSHLDLRAELLSLSRWAESEGPNWFHAVKGALAKRNREVKANKDKNPTDQSGFRWNGIEGVI